MRVTVSKELTRLERSAVKLTLTVAKDEARSEYDKVVADYCKSVQIPGFRKGKVPKAVLEQKLGDSLKGEALSHLLEHAVMSVFEDEQFSQEDRPLPYSSPQIQGEPKLDFDSDMVFSVVYDVFPTVNMGQWKGFEVEIPEVVISDEDINRELEVIRERNAVVMDRDDDAVAAKNDVVTVNYSELTDAGTIISDTEREDFVFTVGSGYNTFKFDDDIVGMKKGESKDIEKTYPEDFEDADLAGKTKKIRITLTALKEKQLPLVDDDFAQDVDEKYHTLDDLKNSIKERLAKELEEQLQNFKHNALLEKLMEATPVVIPESMITVQLNSRLRNMAQRMNIPLENMMNLMYNPPNDMPSLTDTWRTEAVRALHSRLIVETLIKDLSIEASDEEIHGQIERIANSSDASPEEIKEYYAKEGMQEYLVENVKEQKLFDRLFTENSVKLGVKKRYLEFIER